MQQRFHEGEPPMQHWYWTKINRKGTPPYQAWRFWWADKKCWSFCTSDNGDPEKAYINDGHSGWGNDEVLWSRDWPKNPRVARIWPDGTVQS